MYSAAHAHHPTAQEGDLVQMLTVMCLVQEEETTEAVTVATGRPHLEDTGIDMMTGIGEGRVRRTTTEEAGSEVRVRDGR